MAAVVRCIPATSRAREPEPAAGARTAGAGKRGLILMVGATGTGKSTTLASMLEQRNQQMAGHIPHHRDPIEFLFRNKKSVVNQREVGRDDTQPRCRSALKNALRQAPDCILIGEIRDRETMTAIAYALSGHLCWPRCTPTTATTRWGASCRSTRRNRPPLLATWPRAEVHHPSQRLVRAAPAGASRRWR